MARARNIKPSFFMNEDLAELDFGVRLLFVGLWTLADREGRLEDRPKRIKRELFPSDNLDIDSALNRLEEFDFIKRYKFEEFSVIAIKKFSEHQSPHGTEKDSQLPDENGLFTVNERGNKGLVTGKSAKIPRGNACSNDVLTMQEQLSNDSGTVRSPCNNALNPDSGFLNPECGIMNPENNIVADSGESAPTQRRTKTITADDLTQSLEGLSMAVASDYIQFRKQKKAPLNATAWKTICREVLKTEVSPDEAIAEAMAAGWTGFKAEWLANRRSAPAHGRGNIQQQNNLGDRNRDVARRVAEKYRTGLMEADQ